MTDHIPHQLFQIAQELGAGLKLQHRMMVVAESCTGGLVSEIITSIPEASVYFERGFVTYSNLAKIELLGVNPETLERYGAVSEQTVREMVEGALKHSHADVGIAITGVAGPSGGSANKPVGTVCFGWAGANLATQVKICHFHGDRTQVRVQAAEFALKELERLLKI